tara:strand:- start:60 stop:206 length:147 start_codon:yes stop_codon:yes gene_type:complete
MSITMHHEKALPIDELNVSANFMKDFIISLYVKFYLLIKQKKGGHWPP